MNTWWYGYCAALVALIVGGMLSRWLRLKLRLGQIETILQGQALPEPEDPLLEEFKRLEYEVEYRAARLREEARIERNRLSLQVQRAQAEFEEMLRRRLICRGPS